MAVGLKQGTLLRGGSYRIERALGQGGFGITYLATDLSLDREVAIKEFFPKDYCDRHADTSHVTLGTQSNSEFVQLLKAKFLKEAKNIAKLDHPGIVKIQGAFEENNTAYYVMDLIDGESLSARVKSKGRLNQQQAVLYIEQIGSALEYLHSHHMNHLDVKPANVMIRRKDNQAILIDFGLSKQYDAEGHQTSSTPTGISHGFAPMEQYREGGVKEFSPQTDIYSLAATLYYLLTGVVPPQAPNLVDEELKFPSAIPSTLVAPISKAMSSARRSRHDSVSKFLAELTTNEDSEATVIETPKKKSAPAHVAPTPPAPAPRVEQTAKVKSTSRELPEWFWVLYIIIFAGIYLYVARYLYSYLSSMDVWEPVNKLLSFNGLFSSYVGEIIGLILFTAIFGYFVAYPLFEWSADKIDIVLGKITKHSNI